ncbi:MAG: Uma2 family endonuclease [Thermoguttaceae bacterium]|jgi:Uma2 family endonuclease
MAILETLITAEQLLQMPALEHCELIRGELVKMSPTGLEHGRVANRISVRLGLYVEEHRLGIVTTAEAGFQIGHNPDTVRAPDVAFLSAVRVPKNPMAGFFDGPPDLAVEVLSPNDRAGEVLAKIQEWLNAGCRMVWLVDPITRTVSVYHDLRTAQVLTAEDTISGDDLLPGFSLPVAEFFA